MFVLCIGIYISIAIYYNVIIYDVINNSELGMYLFQSIKIIELDQIQIVRGFLDTDDGTDHVQKRQPSIIRIVDRVTKILWYRLHTRHQSRLFTRVTKKLSFGHF